MTLARLVFVSCLLGAFVNADMAPNYPEPGTIWKAGQQYQISWFDDKQSPAMEKTWKKFKIDFMTGDNNSQKFLKNVAKDLDASKVKTLNWTAPDVEPHSAIYFLMFTNEKGKNAWTTRFAITGEDGKLAKPEHSTQPDGAKIPWGVGKLAGSKDTPAQSTATYSMSPAMVSAAEKNAAVIIAVSNAASSNSLPCIFMFTMVLLSSVLYAL